MEYLIAAAVATGVFLFFSDAKKKKELREQKEKDFLKQQADFLKQQDIEREQAEQDRRDLLKRRKLAKEQAEQAKEQERRNTEQRRQDLLRRQDLAKKQLIVEIERHRAALTRNLERAIKKNDYGKVIEDNTSQACYDFYRSFNLDVKIDEEKIIFEHLKILEAKDRESGFDINTIPTDGHEFETWVANGLNKFGWDAKVTAATGDQGIDVIAKKNGKTIGLQCKLLKSSVGNKAVQEAFTGKTFYQTDAVGVMSNAPYTPSAQKIATDTGVKLLSHHDIPNLYEKMFSE